MQRLSVNLGPRYRALSLLAKGGMGAVHLGERFDAPGALLAIKVMHGYIADSPEAVTLFIDEARIGTRIRHPHVVEVLDCDIGDDTPFIVMEYVEGVSLARLLRLASSERIPPDIAARIVHDGCRGLGGAHAAGAVHRDVSPQNLLVGADGRTKITDFGIATFTGRLSGTHADEIRGKVNYLSPEQISRKGVDAQTDLFSAGIVLWEALVGQPLFASGTQSETLAKVLAAPIDPPSLHVPDVPLELEDVCMKALERAKERRYPTADAMADAIARAIPLADDARVAAFVARLGADDLARQRAASADGLRSRFVAPTAPAVNPATAVNPTATAVNPAAMAVNPAAPGLRRPLMLAGAAGLLLSTGLILGRLWSEGSSRPRPAASAVVSEGSPSGAAAPIPPPAESAGELVATAAVSSAPRASASSASKADPRPKSRRRPVGPRSDPAKPDFVPGEL